MRSAKSGSRHTRQRPGGSRTTNEAGDSVSGSQGSVTRGVQNLQISDTSAIQTARSAPGPPMPTYRRLPQARPWVSAVWLRSLRLQSSLRPRPHAAHGSETRGTTTASRKRWAAAPSRTCSLKSLRHHQVVWMSPVQLLRKRYSLRPTTPRTPECRARWLAHRSATC